MVEESGKACANVTEKLAKILILNQMWLLSQGSKVEVLSPQAIRDEWLAEARTIIARTDLEHWEAIWTTHKID